MLVLQKAPVASRRRVAFRTDTPTPGMTIQTTSFQNSLTIARFKKDLGGAQLLLMAFEADLRTAGPRLTRLLRPSAGHYSYM